MASNDEILQQFFIKIGIDASALETGSRQVSGFVDRMRQGFNNLIGSSNNAQEALSEGQRGLTASVEASNRTVIPHLESMTNGFAALSKEMMGFGALSLTIGGGFKWVADTANQITRLSVASNSLGVDMRNIRGWNGALTELGDPNKNAGQTELQTIRGAILAAASGQQTGVSQALGNMGIGINPNSNANDILRQAITAFERSPHDTLHQSWAQQAGLGEYWWQGITNGNLNERQEHYASQYNYNAEDVRRAQEFTRTMANLESSLGQVGQAVEQQLLPYMDDLVTAIDHNLSSHGSPLNEAINEIGHFGDALTELTSIGTTFTRGMNEWQQGYYVQALKTWGVMPSTTEQANHRAAEANHVGSSIAHHLANSPLAQGIEWLGSQLVGTNIGTVIKDRQRYGYLKTYEGNRAASSPYDGIARRIAQHLGIDPEVARMLMMAESSGRNVRNGNAYGPMQLLSTGGAGAGMSTQQLEDPVTNITRGLQYFHEQLVRFHGNYQKAIAAYTDGQGTIGNLISQYGTLWTQYASNQANAEYIKTTGQMLSMASTPAVHHTTNNSHEIHLHNPTIQTNANNLTGLAADINIQVSTLANRFDGVQ